MIKMTVIGTMCSDPTKGKKTRNGDDFAFARISVPNTDGTTELVTVAAFGVLVAVLLDKVKGDVIVVIGTGKSTAWLDAHGQLRSGISIVAQEIT